MKVAYLYVAPLVIAIVGIGILPLGHAFYISLTDLSAAKPEPEFVGLKNYQDFLTAPFFLNSVRVTTIFVVGTVVMEFLVGLYLALLMFGKVRGKKVFDKILFVPIAISPIVMGVLYSPNVVLDDVNTLLYYGLCISPICSENTGIFLNTALPVVYYGMMIMSDVFVWGPLMMLVILAILNNIPKEHFEAAEISGATPFQMFRRLTFPAIIHSPILAAMIVLRVVDNFRAYEIPFTWSFWLFQERLGAPIDTFSVVMFKMLSGSDFPLSQIAAVGLLLMAFSVTTAVVLMKAITKSWEGIR
ncbi:MAG: sugar ABC transporter permease [Thaumarchaeota archaeon]|nr:sugar ABC transporter permease [Nitrososphaerota archaeon]